MKVIDWHAGFVSAMKLELIADEANLDFDDEHYVANRAQRIDLLIIKKKKEIVVSKSIGKIFKAQNILEYKGPGDSLTYEDFHKTLAYAHLYFYEENRKLGLGNGDYTITFVRESKPEKLFRKLNEEGYECSRVSEGIYELEGKVPFKTQVAVMSELPPDEYVWLRSLTKRGTKSNISAILNRTERFDSIHKDMADNIMQVFAKANTELFERIKEEDQDMCTAIEEIFADRFQQKIDGYEQILDEKDAEINRLKKNLEDVDMLKAQVKQLTKELNRYRKMSAQ